ncbi:MAG: hypothetical protein QXH91_04195 [Candidatus Bathyarchaeia archaeon]
MSKEKTRKETKIEDLPEKNLTTEQEEAIKGGALRSMHNKYCRAIGGRNSRQGRRS